jgi:perosamine synthetase
MELLSLGRASGAIVCAGDLQGALARVASPRVSADVLIGVYPPAELSALHPRRRPPAYPFAEPGLTLTHLGRGGVWLALRALGLGRGSRLAMPAYHCGAEVEAAHLAGIELDFYRVDAQLRVDADDLARAATACDATYLISCFGFPMPDPPPDARVIEDAAHGLFSADAAGRALGSRGDAAVFCPRKSLGTPDGGAVLLYGGDRRIDAVAGRPSAGAMARSAAALVAGRAAMARPRGLRARAARAIARASRTDAAAREGRLTETVIGEWGLQPRDLDAAARSPSRLTAAAVSRVDGQAIRTRRRRNYEALRDELAELTLEPFRALPDGTCPLYFPVLAADRGAAIARLLDHGVRALEVWPVPHPILDRERFSELEPARQGLLALPVHQAMEDRHVDVVVRAAKAVFTAPVARAV